MCIRDSYYRGFTKSLCTSLNHVVCHGIPSDRILNDGDAVNVDVTAVVDEHYGDTSRMFCIGNTPIKLNNLINATYESMMRAIKILKPGIKLGDIGYAIQSFVEENGFSVVRDFCGHGIGTTFHETPNILHYGNIAHSLLNSAKNKIKNKCSVKVINLSLIHI